MKHKKLSMRDETNQLSPVVHAELAGWTALPSNAHNTKHFYWDFPVIASTFEVHWYAGIPSFTVDHQTTTSETKAIEWLKQTACGIEPPQPIDDGGCDPLFGQRMDSADMGEN